MGNKTFIPALRAKVGDWDYYICTMKYAEVARQIHFAYELGGNKDLNSMIQRGLSGRTAEITQYLLNSPHRFLGALLIATWGGHPQYLPLSMEDPDGLLAGVDQGFGVLTFDGTQSYFALDGQHRLKSIKDAVIKNPDLGAEDIAILIVSTNYETPAGRERMRRLFTNINRNAKTTTTAENIALDEDDGFSVLTRRFLTDHPFLSRDGVVRVFVRMGEAGELVLAGNSVAATDKTAFTTIVVLRDLLSYLWFRSDGHRLDVRPSDDVLEESYKILADRMDQLLEACGNVRSAMESASSARDVRAPKGREHEGHAMMRPVIQKAIARAVHQIIDQDELTWAEVRQRLGELDWRIGQAPWLAVFSVEKGGMIAGKDFSDLLDDLLYAHLAPQSLQQIKRARRMYRELRNATYPVQESALAARLKAAPGTGVPTLGTDAVSENGSEADEDATATASPTAADAPSS